MTSSKDSRSPFRGNQTQRQFEHIGSTQWIDFAQLCVRHDISPRQLWDFNPSLRRHLDHVSNGLLHRPYIIQHHCFLAIADITSTSSSSETSPSRITLPDSRDLSGVEISSRNVGTARTRPRIFTSRFSLLQQGLHDASRPPQVLIGCESWPCGDIRGVALDRALGLSRASRSSSRSSCCGSCSA